MTLGNKLIRSSVISTPLVNEIALTPSFLSLPLIVWQVEAMN